MRSHPSLVSPREPHQDVFAQLSAYDADTTKNALYGYSPGNHSFRSTCGGTLFLHVQGGKLLVNIVVMPDGTHITDTQLIIERLRHVDVLEWNLTANPASMSPSSEAEPSVQSPFEPFAPRSPTPLPVVPDIEAPSQPSSNAGVLSPYSYPRRAPVDPTWMSTWPFMYRQVYNLSTGHYSEQDIRRLLRYPLEELAKVFDDLQRMNVIQRHT